MVNSKLPDGTILGVSTLCSDSHRGKKERRGDTGMGRSIALELATVALWLASDASSFIMGETITVDGGSLA